MSLIPMCPSLGPKVTDFYKTRTLHDLGFVLDPVPCGGCDRTTGLLVWIHMRISKDCHLCEDSCCSVLSVITPIITALTPLRVHFVELVCIILCPDPYYMYRLRHMIKPSLDSCRTSNSYSDRVVRQKQCAENVSLNFQRLIKICITDFCRERLRKERVPKDGFFFFTALQSESSPICCATGLLCGCVG